MISRLSSPGYTPGLKTPELAGSPGNHIRPTDFFFNGLWPGNAESSSLLYRAYILVLAASASP